MVSRSTSSIPSSFARSFGMNGSYARIFIAMPCARFTTSIPTLPRPIVPRTLFLTSTPVNRLRFHSSAFSDRSACGMFLESASIMATVCSAAEIVFPSGVFATIMPFFVAAATSTLSTPTPALPTILRRSAAFMIFSVTFVPLLITRASYPGIIFTSSSSERPVFTSTSCSVLSSSKPSSAIGSLTRIFNPCSLHLSM
uniref:Uncharacterized protein n=1 Tax=Candidatus Methanogaster sp. ANME-2c ERB4 TaxID=2759911 RepID=A0A7G9YJ74_9EURY|nr:hypothetical protein DFIJPJLC_00001 [Methanosarcinales archaeon ANME-2c ERB4]